MTTTVAPSPARFAFIESDARNAAEWLKGARRFAASFDTERHPDNAAVIAAAVASAEHADDAAQAAVRAASALQAAGVVVPQGAMEALWEVTRSAGKAAFESYMQVCRIVGHTI